MRLKIITKDLQVVDVTLRVVLISLLFATLSFAAGTVFAPKEQVTKRYTDTLYVPTKEYDHIKYDIFFERMKVDNRKAFIFAVKSMAERIGIPYEHIMGVFAFESNINIYSKNKSSGAYGLFQLMPKTAEGLGITREQLYSSDAYEQLRYFEKYIRFYGIENIKTFGDLYLLTYLPSYTKYEDKTIPQYVLDANPAYKHCKTIKEFKVFVEKKFNERFN